MSLYEITFLTREESDPGVKAALEEAGANIVDESSLGRRRLAYPIKQETQAVYTTYVFNAEPAILAGVDRKLRLNTAILRYLVVTKPQEKADKEVSKTVREAIEAAEKLEDASAEMKAETAPVIEETETVETPEVVEAPVAETAPTEETAAEETTEETTVAPADEEAPAKKSRKTAKPADAAEATEEDRLKALEDKLGEILKD